MKKFSALDFLVYKVYFSTRNERYEARIRLRFVPFIWFTPRKFLRTFKIDYISSWLESGYRDREDCEKSLKYFCKCVYDHQKRKLNNKDKVKDREKGNLGQFYVIENL